VDSALVASRLKTVLLSQSMPIYKVLMDEARCGAVPQTVNGCAAQHSRQLPFFKEAGIMLMSAKPREYLPLVPGAHYFTRNRTRGSDFSPFSSLAWEIPTIIARCFLAHFCQRGRSCSS
jgi:hypothetical protein